MPGSDQRATLARIIATLAGMPPQRLRLFTLLPAIYRDGALDEEAVVRLAPEIGPAVAEVEAYIRAVDGYRGQFVGAIDRTA